MHLVVASLRPQLCSNSLELLLDESLGGSTPSECGQQVQDAFGEPAYVADADMQIAAGALPVPAAGADASVDGVADDDDEVEAFRALLSKNAQVDPAFVKELELQLQQLQALEEEEQQQQQQQQQQQAEAKQAQGAQPPETAQQGQGQGQQQQRLQQQREEQEVAQKLALPARTRNPPRAAKRKTRSHTPPGGCDRSDDGARSGASTPPYKRRRGCDAPDCLPGSLPASPAAALPGVAGWTAASRPGSQPVYDYAQLECVD